MLQRCSARVVAGILVALLALPAMAQIYTPPSESVPVSVDSGVVRHNGDAPEIVWFDTVSVPDAAWVRLHFSTAILGQDPRGGDSAVLRITSLLDGAVQDHTAVTMQQWRNSSAYFNGNAVLLELIAQPDGRGSRIVVDEVTAAIVEDGGIGSICDGVDDRQLSNDPRCGRSVPVGCTAWIFNDANGCFLSAGHCFELGDTDVVEFNVPLSNSNGTLNHPGPEDQYATDPASVQEVFNQIGDDWAYFGCFPNTQTGLTPFQAQGAQFVLADVPPPVQGQQIRITGYGTTSFPAPLEWNQVEKTHAGPYASFSGTTVTYRTDTTGGNSGSPIEDDSTGLAIGIHTNGGCGNGSGANSGTGINNSGLQNALANPRGVCASGLDFEYPSGRPAYVDPDGGTTMLVNIVERGDVELDPNTPMFHYDTGGGFVAVPMVPVVDNTYEATFPAVVCGESVRFYVSAMTTDSAQFSDPRNAPTSSYTAISASDVNVILADDFEQDLGWTVTNQNLSTGAWVRADPAGNGSRGDPIDDYDGSGRCFLTGNGSDEDLDGGPTILTSPMFAVPGPDATIQYARWFTCDDQNDFLVVEISNNNGSSWVEVETVGNGSGWQLKQFAISQFVTPTAQMRMRFSAADNPNDSVTEAAIDAFDVTAVSCDAYAKGDLNCDGAIDGADIEPFFLAVGFPDDYAVQYPNCDLLNADMNGDNAVDGADIDPFFDCLGNGNCP